MILIAFILILLTASPVHADQVSDWGASGCKEEFGKHFTFSYVKYDLSFRIPVTKDDLGTEEVVVQCDGPKPGTLCTSQNNWNYSGSGGCFQGIVNDSYTVKFQSLPIFLQEAIKRRSR